MDSLYSQWKKDEQTPFNGWNFSYIKNRWEEEQPPWDYKKKARELIKKATAVLDMGTGGGEILSSLGSFPEHTVATEGWPANVPLARKTLEPLGVKIVAVDESGKLPFTNEEFDLVLNRHSAFDEWEVFRILQKNGIFLTQQVGGGNLKDLIREFRGKTGYKDWNVKIAKKQLENVGFKIEKAEEWSGKVEFKDIGAMVYFLKAIPWVVKGFSVDNHLPVLEKFQKRINAGKKLIFTETRFLIQAKKQ